MFRKMLRFQQQLADEECIGILKNEPRGVLSVLGDDGYPYGVPINHYYCEDDGKLYFHGGKKGTGSTRCEGMIKRRSAFTIRAFARSEIGR